MNELEKYIGLLFDGPMQSWGFQSRFDQRTTLSYPTKSGTIGLICAAMGVAKSDRETLFRLSNLPMQSYTLVRNKNRIRRLKDFHTVGGGYVYPVEKQHISPKADGSKGDTVVTRREFLTDAKYAVILKGKGSFLQTIGDALKNPKWGCWLGRKSCVPAAPIFQGIFDLGENAIQKIVETTNAKIVRKVIDVDDFEKGTDTLRDVPIDFLKREFSIRRIEDIPL
ncbi:MAG: type I-E CRISPR-associated protein Cas5/CasD [Candidatus Scalindua sp.]